MEDAELHLIEPHEIAYRLDLTPAQLKITWTALKSLLDDFGHDERDMHELVREVLDKLPDRALHQGDRPRPEPGLTKPALRGERVA